MFDDTTLNNAPISLAGLAYGVTCSPYDPEWVEEMMDEFHFYCINEWWLLSCFFQGCVDNTTETVQVTNV